MVNLCGQVLDSFVGKKMFCSTEKNTINAQNNVKITKY